MGVDELRSPFALEELSVTAGRNWFVVEAGERLNAADAETLRHLACVTIGPKAVRRHVDVITDDDLDDLTAGIDRTPLTALTLVRLLRAGSSLLAESMAYSLLQAGPEYAVPKLKSPHEATPDPVLVRRDHDTLEVTLNRPTRHNAFDTTMRDGLVEALRAVAMDPGIEHVVLTGAGPSFCSGGDLSEFGTRPDPATAHAVRLTRSPAWWMDRMRERVTARVHGACIGAGIELPAFAREVVAAEDAFFQLPEVAMGLVPGAGGTVSLPRRIGRHRTALLALTGRRIDVTTALDWGLVDRAI